MLRFFPAAGILFLLLCAAPVGAANNVLYDGSYYDTVFDAVEAITDSGTLTIVGNTVETAMIDIGTKDITITASSDHQIQRDSSFTDEPLFAIDGGFLTLTTASGGTLTIDGKGIEVQGATYDGGLICAMGDLTIEEGVTLTNGNATAGGAVYVDGGTFTMTGGTITGNHAEMGGGVYVDANGEFAMSGGIITGNTAETTGEGAGVYVNADSSSPTVGIITMEGSATISADNNVYLWVESNRVTNITLAGPMNSGCGAFSIKPYGGGQIGDIIVYGAAAGGASTANFRIDPAYEFALAPVNGNLVLCRKVVVDGNLAAGYDNVKTAVESIDTNPHTLEIYGSTEEPAQIDIADKHVNITVNAGSLRINRNASFTSGSLFTVGTGSLTINATSDGSLTVDGQNTPAETTGGLVNVNGGTFTLENGATLTNGSASTGGGVYLTSGEFIMAGGNITGNTAPQGGGVAVADGTFTIAGDANVTADNDVYLADSKNIILGSDGMNTGGGAFNITPEDTFSVGAIIVDGNAATGGALLANFQLNETYAAEKKVCLKADGNNLVLAKAAVLNVGTGVKYATVYDAVRDSTDPDTQTLEILDSTEEPASIDIGAKLVNITAAGNFRINRNASFTSGSLVTVGTGSLAINATSGTLTVDGQNITTGSSGGLVNVNGGTFILEAGATLTNGSASTGGGVYLTSGEFIMTGGNITGNNASDTSNGGGGVHIASGTFTMSGGNITGNNAPAGTGVYLADGTFTISDNANVTADNDVYLTDGKNITLAAAMNTGKGVFNITPAATFIVGNTIVDGTTHSVPAAPANFQLNATYAAEKDFCLKKNDKNLVLANAAVEFVETGVKYANVYDGVDAISSSGTLKILNCTDEPASIDIGTKLVNITAAGNFRINRSASFASDSLFTVGTGGSLAINATSGTLTVDGQNTLAGTAGGLVNVDGGTLVLENGATLTNGSASSGGGVYLTSGTLIMTGGNITGNTATAGGAGVYLADGTFTISGGANVTADNDVYLADGKTITLAAAMNTGKGVFNITPADTFALADVVVDGTTHSVHAAPANFILNTTYVTATGFHLQPDSNNLILSKTAPAFPTITYDPANGGPATTKQLSEAKYDPTVPPASYTGYALRGWYYYNGTQVYSTTDRLVETILSTADHNLTALWYQNNSAEWSFTKKLTVTYAAANNLTTLPTADSITFGGGAQKITFNITDNMSAVACADSVGGVHTLTRDGTNITIADGDPAGLYTITYTGSYKGDANLDGVVDILDASGLGIYTIRSGTGFTITDEQKLHGDVTMDGQITVADVLAIHAHIADGG